ncbi:conserved exported hypothetical protein [Candidatus Desulfarcum epimagneticum]|uniref:OmpA-like domain-containing protein n=1 Tax=uncultured Desulfobacteraceae bacterium TaxID=218296 RepID=A0A484HDU8_9BACT|nr:conserved exported hypothetical protein [uncultured Desulfobacteraceae bacterium]
MKKGFFVTMLVGIVGALSVGCASFNPPAGMFDPYTFKDGKYLSDVENLYVIMDATSSMSQRYGSYSKLEIARDFLTAFNQSLPNLEMKSALRVQGPEVWGYLGWRYYNVNRYYNRSKDDTYLRTDIGDYSKFSFQSAINDVMGMARYDGEESDSSMAAAIAAASDDLADTKGKTALMVVTDSSGINAEAAKAAQNLVKRYGDRICVYPVFVEDVQNDNALIQKFLSISGCGFPATTRALQSEMEMARYVDKIFFVDEDGDGVSHTADKCPNTPSGAKVGSNGCWLLSTALFDTGRSVIKESAYAELNDVAKVLEDNPHATVEIQGHTDNQGSRGYNEDLSQKRADAVMAYLVDKGVALERLWARGFGASNPADGNDTEKGRSINRRVELKTIKNIYDPVYHNMYPGYYKYRHYKGYQEYYRDINERAALLKGKKQDVEPDADDDAHLYFMHKAYQQFQGKTR